MIEYLWNATNFSDPDMFEYVMDATNFSDPTYLEESDSDSGSYLARPIVAFLIYTALNFF